MFIPQQKDFERKKDEIRERREKRKRRTEEFREKERQYSEGMRNGTPEEQERKHVYQQEKRMEEPSLVSWRGDGGGWQAPLKGIGSRTSKVTWQALIGQPISQRRIEVLQDDLCFFLDLGFFLNKTFYVRELAYYTWNGEHGRHAFFIPVPYKNLSDKDKQTVNFVRRKIHGLTYQPLKAEHFEKPEVLGELIKDIYLMYKDCSNGERTMVGYKGGHVEKDLLMKVNIPYLNLETLGCLKYD